VMGFALPRQSGKRRKQLLEEHYLQNSRQVAPASAAKATPMGSG
jgi:hypothetical protein